MAVHSNTQSYTRMYKAKYEAVGKNACWIEMPFKIMNERLGFF